MLGLNWDEIWGVLRQAVRRGQERKQVRIAPRYGMGEKALQKGHRDMTVVCEVDRGAVEYVGENREIESLETFWESLTAEQREGIEIVAMDMWQAYVTVSKN